MIVVAVVVLAGAVYGTVLLTAPSAAPRLSSQPAPPAPPGVVDRTAEVIDVVEGDAFVVEGGMAIRVLGADSCEIGTDAGPDARADAARVLDGVTVTLRREPSAMHDTDRDGRLLRYVEVPGVGDLGSMMVQRPHTAVYRGFNDASPAYLDGLRALDRDGRRCADRLPAPGERPAVDYADCAAATTAGVVPLFAGDPGYSRRLDGNDDGVACE